MQTIRTLSGVFRRAVTATMMSSPALAAGCDLLVEPGIEQDPDFVPVRCDADRVVLLADLRPERPVDFIELSTTAPHTEVRGEACKTASDAARCRAALEALPGPDATSDAFLIESRADYEVRAVLHVTRGDEAFAVGSTQALGELLGSVDSAGDAVLLVQVAGHELRCQDSGSRPTTDGYEVQAFSTSGCGRLDRYLIAVARDGALRTVSQIRLSDDFPGCNVGRRPAGLQSPRCMAWRTPGDYLARASTLEAASVAAFRRLAAELRMHAAPRRLITAARAAARDEIRHARLTAQLARGLGGVPERPQLMSSALRELEGVAIENATEGCVRETYGALVARWQALRAADPSVRHTYAQLADDELRHAALAWRVAAWIAPHLHPSARRRVDDARRVAADELRRELAVDVAEELQICCGVPSARQALVLFDQLSAGVAGWRDRPARAVQLA